MILYVIGISSIATLLLNLMLTYYLINDKRNSTTMNKNKKEVLNFNLTPTMNRYALPDTEVLETEIISKGVGDNGYNERKAFEKQI